MREPEVLAVCSLVKLCDLREKPRAAQFQKGPSFKGSELSGPAQWKAEIGFDVFSICVDLSNLRLKPHVHPTGPDHWEGLPEWARTDCYADEVTLRAVEEFWKQFAGRYRGRSTIIASDLLNEP